MNSDNIFSEIINYVPENTQLTREPTVEFHTYLDADFEQARDNLKELADISQHAAKEMARIAQQMQEPRAYDALSKAITSAMQTQKAVVELHRNKQEGKDPGEIVPTTVHNTIILTTDELQKRMQEATRALKND